MSTSESQLAANRINAQSSTGPATSDGKAIASTNATRHGLFSSRLFLEDEDPDEFRVLTEDLFRSLRPIGIAEVALVERVAITIWRQRRLVKAETAAISLARDAVPTAKSVSEELRRGFSSEVKPEHLEPFDADREAWCKGAIAEIEALEEIDLRSIESQAPIVYGQLVTDAEDDTPEKFLADHHTGGLTSYIGELMLWCRRELQEAESRPKLLAMSEQVRARAALLPSGMLEILSRYQTTLDNQLYKALKALREAQEWRLKTLDAATEDGISSEPRIIEAA